MLPDLSESERAVLRAYRDPKVDMRRAFRLSLQYAIGAGIFIVVAIRENNPWWAVVTYLVFLAFLMVRLIVAPRLSVVMPGIIAKYEARITELEAKDASSSGG